MDDRDASPATGPLTQRRVTLAGTALVLVGLVLAARAFEVDRIGAEIAGADPQLLALAVGVYVASWPLRGRRYADVLDAMGYRADTGFLTMATFASQTANLAIPARAGDAVRAHLIRVRRDVPYPAGFASLAVERAFDLVTVAALAGGSILALAALGEATPWTIAGEMAGGERALTLAVGVGAVAVAVAVGAFALARSGVRTGPALRERAAAYPRVERALDAATEFLADVAVVARRPRAIAAIGLGSLLVWSADVVTAVLVLAALGAELDATVLIVVGTLAVSVGNLAKVLPLSQGGIGLYEAAFTGLVVGLTPVGASLALAAAIVDHALKNAVTLVGGAVAVVSLNVSLSEAAADAETGETARETGSVESTATARDPDAESAD
ncbi:MAG TPA: lysylphosphatidylglycerol synthase transmembrane domain-containing protein [Natronoarchaeum rubrum]|nr:lysylphosphatidylglycerol synthase transmembrane domain-containing protein [Natronoarchaeum rubrum]